MDRYVLGSIMREREGGTSVRHNHYQSKIRVLAKLEIDWQCNRGKLITNYIEKFSVHLTLSKEEGALDNHTLTSSNHLLLIIL